MGVNEKPFGTEPTNHTGFRKIAAIEAIIKFTPQFVNLGQYSPLSAH